MRTLFHDGDRVLQGLQLVFDNKNLEMHKLDLNSVEFEINYQKKLEEERLISFLANL